MITSDPFVIEKLTDADLPAAVDLCRAALDLPEDAAEAEPIVARLYGTTHVDGLPATRRTAGFAAWQPAPARDPEAGNAGGPTLVGVVIGSLGYEDHTVGHIDLVAVHPSARRRGIARALLGAAETALASLGAGEILLAGNAPHYAWPGIDVRYTPAICAALACGYAHHETAWNMTAELSDASPAVRDTAAGEARLTAAGVQVRRATADDRAALIAFAKEHFSASWAAEISGSIDHPGAGCHLALREGRVLGFAAYGSSRPSWFGPMGTAPDAQGLGVGGVLLRRCLIDQRAGGHRSAQIGWVGPVPFYSGVADARIERVFFQFRKPLSR